MASVLEIFNRLVEEKHITIKTSNFKTHDALRIRLVKCYSRHKDLLRDIGVDDGSSSLSVCAMFAPSSGTSTFHIRRRKSSEEGQKLDFEIVETPQTGIVYDHANSEGI